MAISRCTTLAALGGALAGLLGLTTLLGGAFDIVPLARFGLRAITPQPNVALAFVLGAASLALVLRPSLAAARPLQQGLAGSVLLIGLLTLGEYAPGTDFGIDPRLLAVPPGRLGAACAVGLVLIGVALAIVGSRPASAQGLAALSGLIGLLPVLAPLYGARELDGVGVPPPVGPGGSLGLALLSLGVLLCRPRDGIGSLLASPTAGGALARRLLPLALVAPALLGWLRQRGEAHGLLDHELGVALVALAHTALFTTFIWRTARQLQQGEHRRRAAEQAREGKTAQLDSLVSAAMDGIVMIDEAQRIVLFNPAAERIFGYPASEVLHGPLEKLLPAHARAAHAEQVRHFEGGGRHPLRPGLMAIAGRRANGEEFPIDASLACLSVHGAPYYVAIVRDATERQRTLRALEESGQRLHTLATATFEGLVVSENGRIMDVNPQLTTLLGYTREELVGLAVTECIAPEGRSQVLANIDAGLDTLLEHEMLCKDGSRRLVESHGQTLQQDGRRIRLTALRDISARKTAENALHAAIAEARRANDAKSRFLAAASHDLRQPLAALSIYTASLKGRVGPAEQPLVANLNDCIGSLSELLNDLLDLSKLDAGAVQPTPRNFPLAELLAHLASVHAPEAQLKGLRLRCRPSTWTIHADQVLLGRILGNLLANAIRYTAEGGVLVGCRRREGKCWMEVWDTGIGIPAEHTGDIFEEFRQLGDGTPNRGSGLGLAIVARTARLLGLAIRVRSRPGKGSLFAIEVPRGEPEPAFVAPAEPTPYRPLRIALVEDNLQFRRALGYSLESLGHRVLSAASGTDLQARLIHFAPDILISDYRLDRAETGFEVIQRARAALGETLPALLLTGDTDSRLVRSMADRGIIVLHKPADLETLQVYLETMTGMSGLEKV